MSDTYTGWDGKSYPWPPPDGWYLASDGRWWAPGTGPNPSAAEAQPAAAPAHTPAGQQARPGEGASPTTQLPVMGGPPNGPSDDGWHAGNGPQATPAHGTDFGRPPSLGSDPYGGYDQGEPPSWSHAPAKKRRRIGRTLLVLFGLLVVVGGAAAGAYIYFFNDDLDDLAASEGSTSVSAPAGDDSAGADTTTSDDTSQTTTVTSSPVDDGTSETAADTTGEATTTAPVDPATQVADFRAILVQNELTSDNLTDEQVITIGNQLCIFAMASTDREGFEAFRSQAINEVDSDRTPEELVLVTNVAVIVFCPDEAQRLGIAAS